MRDSISTAAGSSASLGLRGRDELIEQITSSCLAGSGRRAVHLIGEVGVGKSALLAALRQWALANAQARPSLQLVSPYVLATDRLVIGGCIVTASRRAPGPPEDGVRTIEIQVPRLGEQASLELAADLGVPAPARARLIRWAQGLPLAIVVGADALHANPDWWPREDSDPPAVTERLLRHVFDDGLEPIGPELAAAATARWLDGPALSAMLPESDPAVVLPSLLRHSFIEHTPSGLAMQPLARRAINAHLAENDPQLHGDLRRRLAEHLLEAARGRGSSQAVIELSMLPRRSRAARAFRWQDGLHTRAGLPQDGPAVAAALHAAGLDAWWQDLERWFDEAPERITVALSAEGRLVACSIAVTAANAPRLAEHDAATAPCLAHARRTVPDGNAIIWRDSIDLTQPSVGSHVTRAAAHCHVAAVLHSGLHNPRYAYLPVAAGGAVSDRRMFSDTVAREVIPELSRVLAGRQLECHRIDFGEGGLLAAQRDLVYQDSGLASPSRSAQPGSRETLEEAIRSYQNPARLAHSPLASGRSPAERAASVRALVDGALNEAFGSSVAEQTLRDVLTAAYILPSGGHERAALDLNMSRATYFRKLRSAIERVVEHLASGSLR